MKNLYSVHDQVAGFFLPPFIADNDGIAKRIFIASMGEQFSHRFDYTLHLVGVFNDDDGTIETPPTRLVLAGTSIAPELDPRPRPAAAVTQQENVQ